MMENQEEQRKELDISGTFLLSAYSFLVILILLLQLFYKDIEINETTIHLLLLLLLPVLLPIIKKLKYKDLEIELQEYQSEVADLQNKTQQQNDSFKTIKISPYKIRLDHESEPRKKYFGDKYYKVKVWLDAPKEFMQKVVKVEYERHPTFKNKLKEVSGGSNFEDSFSCWGAFTIKATIYIENEKPIKRQRFLSL